MKDNIVIVEQVNRKYTMQELYMLGLEMMVELDKIEEIFDNCFKKCEEDSSAND